MSTRLRPLINCLAKAEQFSVRFDSNDAGVKVKLNIFEDTLRLTLRLDSAQASLCWGYLRMKERGGDDALKVSNFSHGTRHQ